MKKMIIPICLLIALACLDASAQEVKIENMMVVKTDAGQIRGTDYRENTTAWLGIPYAKPPVGMLRWKAPIDPEPWVGVRDASRFCNYCVQRGNIFSSTGIESYGKWEGMGTPVGSEDCLYLNVFRPADETVSALPVLVFIHGGANILGRSDLSLYDGARLALKGRMVVVTINYRLGYLGWFSLPALRDGDRLDDSGNYGTLDIIKALGWVQKNIAAFGGDPQNVTIAGQSAGAMNVYSLLASPLAAGLFHKAAIFSGFSQACKMEDAEKRSASILYRIMVEDKIADSIGRAKEIASQKGNEWIRKYLMSRKAGDFYPPAKKRSAAVSSDGILADRTFMGIYQDGYVLPVSPQEAFKTGSYNKVPMMIGCTTQEFRLFIPMALYPPKEIVEKSERFDPDNPDFSMGCFNRMIACPLEWYMDRLSQEIFREDGVDTMAGLASAHQKDVYVYLFGWNDEPEPFNDLLGAAHALDLAFWFGNFDRGRDSLFGMAWSRANEAQRLELSDNMMSYLQHFVASGNPNSSGHPEWLPWTGGKGNQKRMFFSAGKVSRVSGLDA